MLEVRGLIAGHGGTDVLRGIDLDVAPGEIVAVLGSYRRGKPDRQAGLEGIFTLFLSLRERATQSAGTLSGAEQRRWLPRSVNAGRSRATRADPARRPGGVAGRDDAAVGKPQAGADLAHLVGAVARRITGKLHIRHRGDSSVRGHDGDSHPPAGLA